ncbi:DNA polymerase Y family protein, partial [Streptomyces amakusaensis]
MTTRPRTRVILHCHFHLPSGSDPGLYQRLLDLCADITPRVQAIPPDAAHLDLTGAGRYWNRDTAGLAAILQLRAAALHGVSTTCGAGPNRMIASMAAAVTPPGTLTVVEPHTVTAWLRPRPTAALHGVGPKTARALTRHGLHTIGDLADTPLPTLTRLLGTTTGRALHTRAHGQDPRPVQSEPTAQSLSAEHRFDRDTLTPGEHRRALLELAADLGGRLRDAGQAADGLTLTVRYADRTTTTRTR